MVYIYIYSISYWWQLGTPCKVKGWKHVIFSARSHAFQVYMYSVVLARVHVIWNRALQFTIWSLPVYKERCGSLNEFLGKQYQQQARSPGGTQGGTCTPLHFCTQC